jgi:hypothetical protein
MKRSHMLHHSERNDTRSEKIKRNTMLLDWSIDLIVQQIERLIERLTDWLI